MDSPAVFVVDDQPSFRRAASAVIAAAGCDHAGDADSAATARSALLAGDQRPDLVLIDVNLGADSGIDLTRELVAVDTDLRIALVSTMAAIDLPSDAATAGAIAFVQKSQLDPALIRELATNTPTGGV
ncbi:MAG: hypothetical protein DHS20C19_08680 [Acidimicrobiales bacterium]|nr:MAG: hypothetical protein DHS20C19_08680 [Acidimicrobiales bacterium]